MADGIADYTRDLAEELAKVSRVSVLSPKNELLTKDFEMAGVPVYPCWSTSSPFYPIQIVQKALKIHARVIHVQHVHLLYGWPAGMPVNLALILCRLLGIKTVVTLHNIGSLGGFRKLPGTRRMFLRRLSFFVSTRLVCSLANRVHVMKQNDAEILKAEFNVSPGKIVVICHGVYMLERVPRDQAKALLRLERNYVVECYGFTDPGKGYESVLLALHDIHTSAPDLKVVFVGCYNPAQERHYGQVCVSYLRKLKRLAADLNVFEGVVFIDVASRDQIPTYLSAADLFLFPYEYGGGASGALHVVSQFGAPVIVSEIPRFSEILDRLNGLRVPSGQPAALAGAILAVYRDREFGRLLGARLQRLGEDRDWRTIAKQTLRLYAELTH
jgi:glycosyltransferase involved in cell wall biosynthesis